jgi:hypothetical protein
MRYSRLRIQGAGLAYRETQMQPRAIRAIYSEIMDRAQAARIGLRGTTLQGELRATTELGVLRCVDHKGKRITVIGQADHVLTLVASGRASDSDGMALKDEIFPVVVNGWLVSS